MTGKTFFNSVSNSQMDLLQLLLDILGETHAAYCIIGGLAVNAYAEPVISLDLDIVIATKDIENVCARAKANGLTVERFEHSIHLSSPKSDLRIQLQTDPGYQGFILRPVTKAVLGYTIPVAAIEDVLTGKVWACSDASRRATKRKKDLLDIARLVEAYPEFLSQLPQSIRKELA